MACAVVALPACGSVTHAQPDGGVPGADGAPGSFTITAPARALLRQGETTEIAIAIDRAPGFDDPIEIAPRDLPAGVTADPLTIPGDASDGTLVLAATSDSTQGAVDLGIAATATDVESTAPLRLLVAGPPGTVDLSFADHGTFRTQVGGLSTVGRGVAIQRDGKILLTGATGTQAFLLRLDQTGAPDSTFGEAGLVSTGVGPFSGGLVVTPLEDRILVSGWASGADTDPAIFAFTPDGLLDETFGAGGAAITDLGTGFGEIHQLLIDSTGDLLAVVTLFGDPSSCHLLRYTSSGAPDGPPVTASGPYAEAALLLPDDRVLIAGAQSSDFWLARLTPTALDPTFGTAGIVTTDFNAFTDAAFGLVVTSGKLLSVGTISNPLVDENSLLALARHNSNGSPDLTFATSGKLVTDLPFQTTAPNAALLDPSSRLLIAGRLPDDPSSHLAVIRLLPDLTPDPTFGTASRASIPFPATSSLPSTGAYGLTLDPDGRILVSGETGAAGEQFLVVARLWP